MPGNSQRRGAVQRSSKGGPTAGSGGRRRRALEGKGPTPKATERPGHKAYRPPNDRPARPRRRTGSEESEWVAGRNAVVEALRAKVPVQTVYVAEGTDRDARVRETFTLTADGGVALLEVPRNELDRLTGGAAHQGLAMRVPAYEYAHPDDLLLLAEAAGEPPLVVALDSVTDPRNLGAVVRSASGFGAHGVLVPERRSAGMTAAAWKTSAGAAARVPVARAVNLTRQLGSYQSAGLMVAGLAADGEVSLGDLHLADGPLVLVIGSEGKGLSRLVAQSCDVRVSIPMASALESLNAGVAAGIALYEIARRRGVGAVVLRLPDHWVWDSWPVPDPDDGRRHLMFLYAPRSLGDPDLRHDNARIGQAVSDDLRTWTRLPDVVLPGPAGAVDDHATWTGSVVLAPDGRWHLYYTGVTCSDGVYRQRVCRAVSDDCVTWSKDPEPVLSADPRWYALAGENAWPDEHWRDPWVFTDPGGDGWHLLVTARARPEQWPDAHVDDLGVIGHAWSADLRRWEPLPPLSTPGGGFGHLEVPQVVDVDGRWCLVFSCLRSELAPSRRDAGATGGHWLVADVDPAGPYDTSRAVPLTDDTLYAGRILSGDTGQPVLVAFDNRWTIDRGGTLVDPLDVVLDTAEVLGAPAPLSRPPEGYGTAPTS